MFFVNDAAAVVYSRWLTENRRAGWLKSKTHPVYHWVFLNGARSWKFCHNTNSPVGTTAVRILSALNSINSPLEAMNFQWGFLLRYKGQPFLVIRAVDHFLVKVREPKEYIASRKILLGGNSEGRHLTQKTRQESSENSIKLLGKRKKIMPGAIANAGLNKQAHTESTCNNYTLKNEPRPRDRS